MAQFKAIVPGVEVNGSTVLAVVEGMGAFKAMAIQILADQGIREPAVGQWYAQQAWLNAFQQIADSAGVYTLKAIGRKIPEMALWPPAVNSIATALASIDVAYHMNHRGGEIGHYQFEPTGERAGQMICDNPYPCDFDWGLVEATARKFAPSGVVPQVKHDDAQPCRQRGADSCTYQIAW